MLLEPKANNAMKFEGSEYKRGDVVKEFDPQNPTHITYVAQGRIVLGVAKTEVRTKTSQNRSK